MELNLSKEDAAFRDELRTFVAENYPTEMRVPNPETDLTKEQSLLWHRILYKKGWIAPSWPKEYGGPGWTITQRYIFEQETSRAGTLPPLPFGVTMVGPVIYTFGGDQQKKRFLPRRPVDPKKPTEFVFGPGERRVIYRWPEIMRAGPGATVFVCEGEKNADDVARSGLLATTVISHKWTPECAAALSGYHLIILANSRAIVTP